MSSVTILLSTYNGQKFLGEQIESLLAQDYPDVTIYVRDDGSSDATHDILNKYKDQGALSWYNGENLKPARSFMSLLLTAPDSEYYAFCDQDDIWMKDKVSAAVSHMTEDVPYLYCSNFQMVDEHLNLLPTAIKDPVISFAQSLFSNYATGCTFVFNRKLREVLIKVDPECIMMHDSWIYKVCLAIGGKIYFDKTPHILYRQHSGNVIGGKGDVVKKWRGRLNNLLNPPRKRYNEAMSLFALGNYLTDESRIILNSLKNYYRMPLKYRIAITKTKYFYSGEKMRDRIVRLSLILKQF